MRRLLLRAPRRYAVVTVLAVLAVLSGYVAPWAGATVMKTSAKDRIEADPPPRLFPETAVAPIGRQIDAQAPKAVTLMSRWWSAHP